MGFSRLTGMTLLVLPLVACCTESTSSSTRSVIRAALEAREHFEILALDPYRLDYERLADRRTEHVHGYEILNRADIEDVMRRREIAELVVRGIDQNGREPAPCFNPRHAIRIGSGAELREILICYECRLILLYVDGSFVGSTATGDSPAGRLDAIWAAHGCPVAD